MPRRDIAFLYNSSRVFTLFSEKILDKVNESAGEGDIGELVEWALPIQERHLKDVRDGSLQLAADEA